MSPTAATSRDPRIHVDARHRVLSVRVVSIGSLQSSVVHPREVFAPAIREGAASGAAPVDLQNVKPQRIAAAIEKLEAKYSGEMDSAYLEYDINHRLDKIQDALNNRDPDSEATQIMNETLALGKSCTFGS